MIGIIMKAIFAISRMSKKTSAIFVSILSFVFFISTWSFIFGLIMIDPKTGITNNAAIPLVVCGGFFLVLSVVLIAMTTLASNYVRKNPHKDPKLKVEEKDKK